MRLVRCCPSRLPCLLFWSMGYLSQRLSRRFRKKAAYGCYCLFSLDLQPRTKMLNGPRRNMKKYLLFVLLVAFAASFLVKAGLTERTLSRFKSLWSEPKGYSTTELEDLANLHQQVERMTEVLKRVAGDDLARDLTEARRKVLSDRQFKWHKMNAEKFFETELEIKSAELQVLNRVLITGGGGL